MVQSVSLEQLRKDAVDIFHNGFACSESVIYSIRKNFELDMSDDAFAMSTGFPWGLGGAGCLCGAVAGGTMCIGYVFGRRKPDVTKASKNNFRKNTLSLNFLYHVTMAFFQPLPAAAGSSPPTATGTVRSASPSAPSW